MKRSCGEETLFPKKRKLTIQDLITFLRNFLVSERILKKETLQGYINVAVHHSNERCWKFMNTESRLLLELVVRCAIKCGYFLEEHFMYYESYERIMRELDDAGRPKMTAVQYEAMLDDAHDASSDAKLRLALIGLVFDNGIALYAMRKLDIRTNSIADGYLEEDPSQEEGIETALFIADQTNVGFVSILIEGGYLSNEQVAGIFLMYYEDGNLEGLRIINEMPHLPARIRVLAQNHPFDSFDEPTHSYLVESGFFERPVA